MRIICKLTFYFIVLFSLLTTCFAKQGSVTSYKQFVFFGDSLSDNGNLFRLDLGFFPKSPPYFKGRFSNGYVWSDLLAQQTDNIPVLNYAVGGQTAILHFPDSYLPLSLESSVNSYLVQNSKIPHKDTLFFIWIGANDYIPDTIKDDENFLNHVNNLTDQVIEHIEANIEKIMSYGALNFILINLPDISQTPFGSTAETRYLLKALTEQHNFKLLQLISKLKTTHPDANVQLFDADGLFREALENTQAMNKRFNLNITDTTHSCWQGGYTVQRDKQVLLRAHFQEGMNSVLSRELMNAIAHSPSLNEAFTVQINKHYGQAPCINPEQYLFWDHVHPSAVVHEVLAKRIGELVKEKFN